MSKHFNLLVALLLCATASLSLTACSDDDDDDASSASTIDGITITTDAITFTKDGGTEEFSVYSLNATASSSETWCTVEMTYSSSSLGFETFTVTAEAYSETVDRTADITVYVGSSVAGTITVTQTSVDYITLASSSDASLTASADGETFSITVNANAEPEATADVSWLSATVAAADESNTYVVTVTVSKNLTSTSRTGNVTLTNNDTTRTIAITQAAGETSDMSTTATEIAKAIYAGINIGNTMECTTYEGAWSGAKVNETYIDAIVDAGFNAVRIPCAWDTYIDDDDDTYTIDSDWLDRVDEVVSWCIERDLYVVLNAHWDNGWLEDNIFDEDLEDDIVAEQKAIWTQVATKLSGYDEHLIFAASNEPGMNETSGSETKWGTTSGTSAIARLIEYEQTMIDAVRATGGNNAKRCIVVQGLGTSISSTYSYMTSLPTDEVEDRLLVEVHYYEPYQFCLMTEDASWGNVFYYYGEDNYDTEDTSHNPTWGEVDDWLIPQMEKMTEQFVNQGYPVIIGEYGCDFRSSSDYTDMDQDKHDASVSYFCEAVTREAKNAGCVPFFWETGSVFNRTTGVVKREDVIEGIMQGAADGEYPF